MAWVIDTSVLIDIRLRDPKFGITSANCLAQRLSEGLVLCPISYIELAPSFGGDHLLQQAFLRRAGVDWLETWKWSDTQMAHQLWADHVAKKRSREVSKRPVGDVLIEAFAMRFQGVITRNPKHFTGVATIVP
jgi:predicted nucleic acid-binding protein